MINTTLDKLPLDTYCEIQNIRCSSNIKRRLLDLGMIKGTKIRSVLKNPMGDPTAYEIRGSIIAVRKEESKLIDVALL